MMMMMMGTLVPIDGNIDSRKYVKVLDETLWPVVCKHLAGRQFIFQDDNAPVHQFSSVQFVTLLKQNVLRGCRLA